MGEYNLNQAYIFNIADNGIISVYLPYAHSPGYTHESYIRYMVSDLEEGSEVIRSIWVNITDLLDVHALYASESSELHRRLDVLYDGYIK